MEYTVHFSGSLGSFVSYRAVSQKMEAAGDSILAQVLNLKTDNINEDAASMVTDASAAKLGISGGVVSADITLPICYFLTRTAQVVDSCPRSRESDQ